MGQDRVAKKPEFEMKYLQPILTQQKQSGLYRLRSRAKPESILASVADQGWMGFHVDGKQIHDKATFLTQFAEALSFPDYFGKNWDAFNDCITDMMWLPAPGYVVLYDHVSHFSANEPKDWSTARSILHDATRYWHSRGKPMYILLRKCGRTTPDIEKI